MRCRRVYRQMEFWIEPRMATPPVAEDEVIVKAPPDVPRDVPVNPLSRLLPAAMAVATVGMMVIYFTSGTSVMRSPMFMFFPVMMLMSLAGTVAAGTRGRTAEINQNRRDYLGYLESLDKDIAKTVEDQRISLTWRDPHPASLWTLVGGRRMWERRPEDPDFGHVRLGVGSHRLSTNLVPPDARTGRGTRSSHLDGIAATGSQPFDGAGSTRCSRAQGIRRSHH